MLSAVEHIGAVGLYSHPFGRPPPPVSVVQQQQLQQQQTPMSAEFLRPQPRPKYSNGGGSISNGTSNGPRTNGLTPPRQHQQQQQQNVPGKYSSEQNGPVNLTQSQLSPPQSPSQSPKDHHHNDQKEIDVVGLGNGNSNGIQLPYSTNSRLSFPTSPGLGTNAYQALNYSFYGNRYGTPGMFPQHPMQASNRAQYPHHQHRPTLMEAYQSYQQFLPPVSFSQSGGHPSMIAAPPSMSQMPLSSSMHQQQHHQQQPVPTSQPSNSMLPMKSTSDRSHSLSSVQSMTNGHHPYAMKDKEPKSAGGKMSGGSSSDGSGKNNNNFKVPSGKEGSLKHRILTRPFGEKDGKQRSPNTMSSANHPAAIANRPPITNNSLTNFSKGSLIELANGDYRRVEELRTEDFILSAEKSPDLQLADSTVVKILTANNNNVMITFSYDNNRSKVDIEATLEHPFFVYGQGWASCNPNGSEHHFGLKCQRLQVGDVCISLKPRELKLLSPHKKSNHQQQQQQQQQHNFHHQQQQQLQQQQTMKEEMYPQNLSRRSQTIPTTATGIAVTSRQIPPMEHHSGGPPFSPSLYLHHALFAAAQGRMPNLPASYTPYNLSDKQMTRCNGDLPRVQQHEHEITSVASSTTTTLNTDQLPLSMVLPKTTSTSTSSGISSESDDYNDPSRKRRWSAPDVEDGDQQSALHPPPPRKLMN